MRVPSCLMALVASHALWSSSALAQSPPPAAVASGVASAAKPAAAVTSGAAAALQAATAASAPVGKDFSERIATELAANSARMSAMEKTVGKSSEAAEAAALRGFWLALIAVAVAVFNQWGLFWHQRVMRREDASDEVSNAYVDWQLKQLSELYGPLRALLGQSNAMYRQMNKALSHARPEQFRLQRKEGGDFDDFVFQIYKDGEWKQFRTVRDLGDVYNRDLGVEPYFDSVVEVGRRMVQLIEAKAGYARPEDTELVRIMGVYLAHHSVLSRLHAAARKNELVEPTIGDQEATFPLEIQTLVDKGFNALNDEVMRWRSRAWAR